MLTVSGILAIVAIILVILYFALPPARVHLLACAVLALALALVVPLLLH